MAQYFMNEKDAGIIRDTVKRVAAGWTPRPQVTPNHRDPVTDTEVEGGGVGLLKSVPSSGSGRGSYVDVVINEFGDFVETGAPKPVVIPRIYHID
mgnify:CR=1 FL=1|jgi:hypothetical protein